MKAVSRWELVNRFYDHIVMACEDDRFPAKKGAEFKTMKLVEAAIAEQDYKFELQAAA